jgi:hypothetical protein
VEVALHPNLMADSTQGENAEDILTSLKNYFPEAVGVRTHRLYWNAGLLKFFARQGIIYDSSLLMPFQPNLRPYKHMGVVRFPIWWSDGIHFERDLPLSRFDVPGMGMPGLKVLLFHPVYIYLNALDRLWTRHALESLGGLANATSQSLEPFRRSGPGMETVFKAVLQSLVSSGAEVRQFKEIIGYAF